MFHRQKDKDIARFVVKKGYWTTKYLDQSLLNDIKFMYELIEINPEVLQYCNNFILKDRKVVLEVIKKCSEMFKYIDVSLKKLSR